MTEKKILTAKEVAELLKTPLVTVLRWAHQGKIPSRHKDDGCYFKRNDILEWARSHDFVLTDERESNDNGTSRIYSRNLSRAIERGGVIHHLKGKDMYSVLEKAVRRIPLPEGTDRQLVLNELLNREEIASTGIGKGVAIPHPRCTLNLSWAEPVIPVVFLEQPVDYNAVDGKDVFVLFFIFSPNTQIHLKLLSQLSLCLRNKDFIAILMEHPPQAKLLAAIKEIEENLEDNETE